MADELKQTNQDYTDEEELEFIDSKFFVDLVDALVPALSAFDQEHDTKIYAKCIAEFVGGTFEEEFCSDSAFGHGVKDNPFHETMLKVKLLEDGSVIARDTYCDRNRASEFDAIGTYLINAAVLHKTERIYDLTILMVVNGHDINGVQHEDATIQLKCRLIHCIQEGTKSLSIVARPKTKWNRFHGMKTNGQLFHLMMNQSLVMMIIGEIIGKNMTMDPMRIGKIMEDMMIRKIIMSEFINDSIYG
eukprot:221689_1